MWRSLVAVGLLVVLAASVATWALLREGDRPRTVGAVSDHHAPVPEPRLESARLRGRPAAAPPARQEAIESEVSSRLPPAPVPPELTARLEAVRLAMRSRELWPEDGPREPRRPEPPDPSLGDPDRRARVSRLDLLGRRVAGTGPWLEDGRALRFDGVVEVTTEREGQGTAEDGEEVEDPLVTAVVGRVAAEGAPLAGAQVILYSTFYLRHARYDHRVREVGRTTTDGEGVFDLRPIGIDTVHFGSDGEVLITIQRDGYASLVAHRLSNLKPEQVNDIGTRILPSVAASLSGTVRDRRGEPVVGAAVRVSGELNPVLYDKTERMVVLKDCPTAITDEQGRYVLGGFSPGQQMVSIHVNIDCVLRLHTAYGPGEHTWSPTVLAGGSVRGRIIDGKGDGIADAVVSGGSNWTPSNPDGTFWLDNIEDGPFPLEVVHHAYRHVTVPTVVAGTEGLEVVLDRPLPRIRLEVTAEASGAPVPIVAIDWAWSGSGPSRFVPVSPYWHAKDGVIEVVVPENARAGWLSAEGHDPVQLSADMLEDGLAHRLVLPRSGD